MASIKYSISPTTAILNDTQGVVALTNNATNAKGVGIQLTNSNGAAIVFDQPYSLSSYTGSAGNYTIPLKVTYFRTNTRISSGIANTAFEFTMTYQ
jgi:major type 1 subunit fimbrin (pilin)